MLKYFIIFTFFTSLSLGLYAQVYYPSFDKINTVTEARADIDFIKNLLEKDHPNLYKYIGKTAFNKKIDSLKRSINKPITQVALKNAIMSVLTSIGNGHLALLINISNAEKATTRDATLKSYPIEQFNYRILQGRLFVTEMSESNAMITPGAEILSIDGITTNKMLADFCSVISSDGYNQSLKFYLLNQGRIPELFTQFYGLKETLSFKVKVGNSTRVVQVDAVQRRNAVPFKADNVEHDFKILPNASAYLKIGEFNSRFPHLSIFQNLSSSQTTSLILDLRNNTGGDYLAAANLFSYLIDRPSLFARVPDSVLNNKLKTPDERVKYGTATPIIPQPLRFKGTIHILINGGTFSAASLLAANLQGMGRAVVIGEESGGGRNYLTGGLIIQAVLPNSRLILRFGNIAMETPLLHKIEGRGVIPDKVVSYSIMEYLSGQDKELERAKNEIQSKTQVSPLQ